MSQNFKAPNLRPPRVSLLSSADIIDVSGDKWMGGIELYPLSGTDASGLYPICPVGSVFKDATNRVGGQRFQPFAIYATDNCSTYGSGGVDFEDRARQKLKAVESFWIERALWENPDGLSNPSFTGSPSTVVGAGAGPLGAFAALDSAVANDLHDGMGMVHMTTLMFDLLQQYRLFHREGNVWYSPLDNIVVPGRGYTGNGPNADGGANENPVSGTAQWMFGHPGIIQILRGSIDVLGADPKEMNRAINDVWVTAERAVAFVLANGVGDDAGANVTGFYAALANPSLVPGA